MVPTVFTVLDAFPVTVNGKLDRRALPAPDIIAATGAGRAPTTPTETALAAIYIHVLNLPLDVTLAAADDFFRLGGDSILSIQVVSAARRQGLSVTAADVFTARTVGALARTVDQRGAASDATAAGAALPEVSGSALWPIAAQWADEPGFDSFTQSFTWVTPAGMIEDVLTRIVERVVAHHPALQARLLRDDAGQWWFETDPAEPAAVAGRL
nr:phosphopantetheine-binding protein [Micromonospora sp. DSM 115978]